MSGISYLQQFQKPALRGLVNAMMVDKAKTPTWAGRFLPDDKIHTSTFAYDIIKKSNQIAAMIGYGAEPPIVDRDAVAQKMGEIAKMGLKYVATEEELLALAQARGGEAQRALIDKLSVKGVDLVTALQLRVDVIKMEALTRGTFRYSKNGVKIDVDFGVPGENRIALTGANTWSDPAHDVIGDLMAWVQSYQDTNGGRSPSVILMSREIQALLLKNEVVIAESGRPTGATRANVEELTAVLGSYGLPPVQVVTNRTVTVKDIYSGIDEVIEFFPINRVVMLSEGIGNFLYGPTVENDYQPGISLEAYDLREPIQSVLRVVAAGFPAIEAPSLIFHADVFEA